MTLALLALEIAPATLVEGVSFGLAYGLLAVGFVLLYRTSKVLNLAYAEVGLLASSVLLVLVVRYGWSYWAAAVVALACGAAVGGLVEATVIRRLAQAPKVVTLVATAGVAQLLLVARSSLPQLPQGTQRYPTPFEWSTTFGGASLRAEHLVAVVTAPTVLVLLAAFLHRSIWGIAIRGSASNLDGARLAGVPAGALATIVWAIGGALATVTQLVVRPLVGVGTSGGLGLDTRTLVVALTAATVARLRSLPVAMATGVGLGVAQRILLVDHPASPGLFDVLCGLVVVIAILSWRRRDLGDSGQEWMYVTPPPAPASSPRWWVRHAGGIALAALGVAAAVLPLLVTESSRQFLFTRIVIYAIAATSVTLLTGWAGQLSLGQFAFAGIAAFAAMRAAAGGAGFVAAAGLGVVVAAGAAVLVGLPALRVRGLLLAVTTLAFASLASADLYRRILGTNTGRLIRSGTAPIDLGPQRTFYWFCLALLVVVAISAARIRRRGPGRRLVAVRSNEANASAFALRPAVEKLVAFAIAGAVAGLAGVLLAANAPAGVSYTSEELLPAASITILAIAVVGGLTSVQGSILGALWVVGIPAFFPGSDAAPLLAGGVGLLVVLLYFPGGLAQVATAAHAALVRWDAHRPSAGVGDAASPTTPTPMPTTSPAITTREREAPAVRPTTSVLETRRVSVRFGGLAAVRDVSIHVDAREVVGLIGANGAGKSTLMNAIGGYVPMHGSVRMHGAEIGDWPASRRSAAGLGRGFQNAALFPEMPVREAIQVSVERSLRSSWTANLLALPSAASRETAQRRRADELIDLVGLGRYARTRIGELSTGTRRIVELACLVGHGGSVICLDEPTAGVAQRETEAFGPLLLDIRRELDASLIVIEHDMPLIMSMSDRVYCMEAGEVIAHGSPADVRDDPLVVASYLGTNEVALARSDV